MCFLIVFVSSIVSFLFCLVCFLLFLLFFLFFFNDTATTEIYTLSLHDALPISLHARPSGRGLPALRHPDDRQGGIRDRKSTRLNSSHRCISYAVFCLKKKKKKNLRKYIESHQSSPIKMSRQALTLSMSCQRYTP